MNVMTSIPPTHCFLDIKAVYYRNGTLRGFRAKWIVRSTGHAVYASSVRRSEHEVWTLANKYLNKRADMVDTTSYGRQDA